MPDVKELYLKRWKDDDWDEGDDQDKDEFLDLEKKIYLEMSPYNKAIFEDKDEDEDINEVETVEGAGSIPVARLNGTTVEENRKPSATSKNPVARSKAKTTEEDKNALFRLTKGLYVARGRCKWCADSASMMTLSRRQSE